MSIIYKNKGKNNKRVNFTGNSCLNIFMFVTP